ncbi:PfkB family carbohydrate kinase [Herbiconiux sp.]|uniref:carbohydrate kinase family protein n=1 Tax=Herbiconiux sp. TaxID=1871186 RepID=UPI0025B9DC3D|nr:PfkB family carbohydrate kinase [Herbiconiux sp.]
MSASAVPASGPWVVVFGDVIDDVIVTPSGPIRADTDTTARIERRAGGSAANAAAWFGHLGHRTHFAGRVAADDVQRHDDELRRTGVTPYLHGDATLPTGTIVVILQPDRTRTMLTERGANALTTVRDVDHALFSPGGHLHFTGYSLFSDPGDTRALELAALTRAAQDAGASVSVNPGSAGFIADHGSERILAAMAGADVVIPNLDEGRALTGRDDPEYIAEWLLERHPLVALTMGRQGVLVASRAHGLLRRTAVLVTPVDTTGAGDAFSAGFVGALLTGCADAATPGRLHDAPPELLSAAADAGLHAASQAVTRLGGRP